MSDQDKLAAIDQIIRDWYGMVFDSKSALEAIRRVLAGES